ncbi:CPBP family intramembrane glutamic endopeptidase [Shimia sp. FJ5]|uniref:CPBP family intramembrane glutamic endopeptidase n=1 Tax=Shimia sp. FJ5 TaxID=3079054 RepID=UPI00260E91CC|nr:type II CAAX endopeptidase family protein [Shimia sp. FJ5]MDV4143287.1 type II CAAX endopeptidase family protein [Shimia sp. FJ5]
MSAYRPHEALVASARPTAELWRLVAAIVLIVLGFLALNIAYFQTLASLPAWNALRIELRDGSSARAIWAMLGNFVPLLIVVVLAARLLNGRNLAALTGPLGLVLRDFTRVGRLALLLFFVVFLIPSPGGAEPVGNMAFGAWVRLLPLSLLLIFIQIGTEELLFRGYLQSQIAARFSSPIAWMVIPSILFGALHYEPSTYGENAIWLAAWSGLFGLAAADLTARAGNLGPALALHFLNNVSAMMFSAMRDHWDGLALYVYPFGPEDTEALRAILPLEGLVILCGWLVARVAIRR